MGRIFISHRNTANDNAWAAKIHAWIKDQKGISGFLDFDIQDGLQVGEKWEDEIYAAMNAAQVVVAVVSKDWLASDWCMSEARMARLLGLKLILIITEECTVPFRDTQSIRLEKHGEAHAFDQLREALRTTHKLPDRPYPGLVAFQDNDAAVFFGREDETRALENRVDSLFQGRPETARLLLLLGASGSGKSSLMRAGFIPGFKSNPTHFCIEPIIPRGDPLGELAFALDLDLDDESPEEAARSIVAEIKARAPAFQRAILPIDQAEELLRGDHTRFFDVLRAVLERGRGRIIALATMRSDFLNAFQQSGLVGSGTALPYDTFTLDPLPQDRLPDIIQKPAGLYGVSFEEGLIARILQDHGGPDALPLLAFFLNEFWRREYISDGVLQVPEYESFGGLNKALKRAVQRAIEACQKDAQTERETLLAQLQDLFLGRLVAVNSGSGEAVRSRVSADRLTAEQMALLNNFSRQRLLIERNGSWEVVHEALLRQWDDLRDWIAEAREDLIAIDRIEAAATHWAEAGREEADLTHGGQRLAEAFRMVDKPRYADRFAETATAYLEACRNKERDRYEQEKALREAAERERDRAERQRVEAEAAQQAAEQQKAAAEDEARRAMRSHRLSLAALSSTALKTGRPEEAAYLALAAWPRAGTALDDLAESGTVVLDALSNVLPRLREIRRFAIEPPNTGGWFGTIEAVSSDGKCVTLLNSKDQSFVYRLHNDGSVSGHALTESEATDPGEQERTEHSAFLPVSRYILRSAEWATGWELAERTGTFIKPVSKVKSIREQAFHRGDTHVTVIDNEDRVWLWDLAEDHPKEILKDIQRRWESHVFDEIYTERALLDLSPDGAFVAVWESDKVRVFDCTTEQVLVCIDLAPTDPGDRFSEDRFSATFSPCGTLWAGFMYRRWTIEEVQVRVWDLRTGSHSVVVPKLPASSPTESSSASRSSADRSIRAIRYASDGTCLSAVMRSQNGVDVATWNLSDGRRTASLEVPDNAEGKPPEIVLCSDGALALVGSYTEPYYRESDQREVLLIENYLAVDIASGQTVAELDSMICKPISIGDGPFIMRHSFFGVSRYDIQSDRMPVETLVCTDELWLYPNHMFTGCVLAAAFSPDGSRFVACEGGLSFSFQGEMDKVVVSPFGAQVRLWCVHDEGARVYSRWEIGEDLVKENFTEPDEGSVVYDASGRLRFLFSPCGEMVAVISVRDGLSISFRDSVSGELLGQLRFSDEKILSIDSIEEIAFTPDGSRMTVPTVHGSLEGVSLYDVGTGERMARLACLGGFSCMTIAPDGNHVFVGQQDGSILRWNVAYGAGTLFDVVYRRMPVLTPPAIASEFGMALEDEVYSGEEPLPNTVPVPRVKQENSRDLALEYPIPVIGLEISGNGPSGFDAPPLDDLLPPSSFFDPELSSSVPPAPPPRAGFDGGESPFADSEDFWGSPPTGEPPSIEGPAGASDPLMPPLPSPPPDHTPPSTPPTHLDWAENPFSPPPKPSAPFDEESE